MKVLRKFYVLLFTFFFLTHVHSQSFGWGVSFGGQNYDHGYAVAMDTAGNTYCTGGFHGTIDFDPGPGSSSFTTSVSSTDIFITKFDRSGNFLWAKTLAGNAGTNVGFGYALTVDDSQNVLITGYFTGTKDFNPGPGTALLTSVAGEDVFICKLDVAGNFLWVKQIGGGGNDVAKGIATDGSCNVVVTGSFDGTADFDPDTGTYNLTTAGNDDIFICKLDAQGNFIWAESAGAQAGDVGMDIACDSSGNVYSIGTFEDTLDFDPGIGTHMVGSAGTADVYILKTDPAGNFIWLYQVGGFAASSDTDRGNSIDLDNHGNIYATGMFTLTADFDAGPDSLYLLGYRDVFACKLTPQGNIVWAKSVEGSGSTDEGTTIAVSGNDVFVGGNFEQTVDFDPDTAAVYNVTSLGWTDMFIWHLDTAGNYIQASHLGSGAYDGMNAIDAGTCALNATGYFGFTMDFDPGVDSFMMSPVMYDDVFLLSLRIQNTSVDTLGILIALQAGATYQWLDCATMTPIPGATTQSFLPGVNGSYAVAISNGICYDTSACVSYDMIGISDNINAQGFSVVPNPAHDEVILSWTGMNCSEIRIMDMTGKVVMSIVPTGQQNIPVDLSGFAPGMYNIVLSADDGIICRKVIIE